MGDLRITVTANDESGDVLTGLQGKLDDVKSSAEGAGGGFDAFATAAATGTSEAEHAMNMFNRMDISQITVGMSTDRVAQAQLKYNEALAKSGPNSQQAEQAAYQLQRAHESLDKAQIRAEESMGLVVVQSISMATKIPEAAAGLFTLEAAEIGAARAGALLEDVLTLGAGAIAVIAGWTAIEMTIGGIGTAADASAAAVDALDLQQQKLAADKSVEELTKKYADLSKAVAAVQDNPEAVAVWSAEEKAALDELNAAHQKAANLQIQIEVQKNAQINAATAQWESIQQAQADQVAKDYEVAASKASQAFQSAMTSGGVNLGALSLAQLALAAQDTVGPLHEAAQAAYAKKEAEESMAATILATGNPALIAQLHVAKDKTGAMDDLNKRIYDAQAAEGVLPAAAGAATAALSGQVSVVSRLGSALGDAARQVSITANYASVDAKRQAFAAVGIPTDALGNPDWSAMSFANTQPGVDVTGIAKGLYAPLGQGFTKAGDLGSTDLKGSYGSRTLIRDNGDGGGGQGGGTVNMGGVTINVQVATSTEAPAATAAALQQAVPRFQRLGGLRNY